MLKIVRVFGPFLLVIALCLPVSKCTTIVDKSGNWELSVKKQPRDHLKTKFLYLVPLKSTDWTARPSLDSPYFILLSFLWPSVVLLLSLTPKLKRWYYVLFWSEFIPLLYAAGILYVAGWFIVQPFVGAYLGAFGVTLCGMFWIFDVARLTRDQIKKLLRRPDVIAT